MKQVLNLLYGDKFSHKFFNCVNFVLNDFDDLPILFFQLILVSSR